MDQAIFRSPIPRKLAQLLYNNGPLDRNTLQDLISPRLPTRTINYWLKRLIDMGICVYSNKSLKVRRCHLYQLSNALRRSQVILDLLKLPSSNFKNIHFRAYELDHSLSCAYWREFLERLLPSCDVTREFHLDNKNLEFLDQEVIPDIAIAFSSPNHEFKSIAVEIERTRKSNNRLRQKLRRYCNETHYDGILYVASNQSITKVISDIYERSTRSDSIRNPQQMDNFLMFSNLEKPLNDQQIQVFSPTGENISLKDWLHKTIHKNGCSRECAYSLTLPTLASM